MFVHTPHAVDILFDHWQMTILSIKRNCWVAERISADNTNEGYGKEKILMISSSVLDFSCMYLFT